jgi:hypothetical protein
VAAPYQIRPPRFIAMVILVMAASGQPTNPPRFADYPVSTVYKGPVKPLQIGDPKKYSAVDLHCLGADSTYHNYAKVQSNFAGHFVVNCTCGTGDA